MCGISLVLLCLRRPLEANDGLSRCSCAAHRPPQPLAPTRNRHHLGSTPTYLRAAISRERRDPTLKTARRFAHLQVRPLQRNLTMKSAPYGGYRVIEPQPPTINNSPPTENFLSLDFSPTPLQVFARPADPTDQLVDLQSWSSRPRRRASSPTSIRPRSTSSFRASLATTASSPRATRPPAVCCLSALLSDCALSPPAARQRRLAAILR